MMLTILGRTGVVGAVFYEEWKGGWVDKVCPGNRRRVGTSESNCDAAWDQVGIIPMQGRWRVPAGMDAGDCVLLTRCAVDVLISSRVGAASETECGIV